MGHPFTWIKVSGDCRLVSWLVLLWHRLVLSWTLTEKIRAKDMKPTVVGTMGRNRKKDTSKVKMKEGKWVSFTRTTFQRVNPNRSFIWLTFLLWLKSRFWGFHRVNVSHRKKIFLSFFFFFRTFGICRTFPPSFSVQRTNYSSTMSSQICIRKTNLVEQKTSTKCGGPRTVDGWDFFVSFRQVFVTDLPLVTLDWVL